MILVQDAEPTTLVIDQPGVYDLPAHSYHADPVPGGSLSASGAKKLLDCPARFQHDRHHPAEQTDAMRIGTAVHRLVLDAGEPLAVFDAASWVGKAAAEFKAATYARGETPLLRKELDTCEHMALAVRAHPLARELFNPDHGRAEQSIFWQDAEYKVWRRARLDWLPHAPSSTGRMILADYKTSVSAHKDHISRAIHNYGYHLSAAQYIDAVRATHYDGEVVFLLVVQEKTPPYLVNVVQIDDHALSVGWRLLERALERFRDCTEADVWPGYSDDIELVGLPRWADRGLEDL
jgi:hypothetical protein